jgi:hypothetical protein
VVSALSFLLLAGPGAGAGRAADPPATSSSSPAAAASEPALQKLDDGRYRIGTAILDKVGGSIAVPGKVNMQEGLIEVFACTSRGKLHEAALELDVEPIHLQTALLAMGLEYGRALSEQGEARRPEGDPVEVWVSWGQGSSAQKWRAEDLVWDTQQGKPMRHVEWVFSGSQIINGTFMAGVEGQIVTTYHDPFTILDNPLEAGADDTVYEAYKDRLPPPGTPVEVTFVDARAKRGGRG